MVRGKTQGFRNDKNIFLSTSLYNSYTAKMIFFVLTAFPSSFVILVILCTLQIFENMAPKERENPRVSIQAATLQAQGNTDSPTKRPSSPGNGKEMLLLSILFFVPSPHLPV